LGKFMIRVTVAKIATKLWVTFYDELGCSGCKGLHLQGRRNQIRECYLWVSSGKTHFAKCQFHRQQWSQGCICWS
jgi:hypothetical protein